MTSIHLPDPTMRSRADLRARCGDCFALCCTAFGFQRSADFPIDKPAGSPCRNLSDDFACTIHASLTDRGFRGCTVFDCFGAGQYVSQQLYRGVSWREDPESAAGMFTSFGVARQLHEMLWHLVEARDRSLSDEAARLATDLLQEITVALGTDPETLIGTDVVALHARVRDHLVEVSAEVRGGYATDGVPDAVGLQAGCDLAGVDLRGRSLCGADLRGACLIATDLRGCDLSAVDLLGADLRDARLDDADLSTALFLAQPQVNAAHGNDGTVLPAALDVPDRWRSR